jgi:hypothetical protein
MSKVFQVAVVTVVGLTLAGAAWAVPPEKYSDVLVYDGCDAQGDFFPLYDCGGGFVICEAAVIDWKAKLFFNKAGEPVRYWEQQKLEGGLYELGNPDNFLPYNPLTLTYKFHYISGEEVVTGVWALITVPGYGQIFKDVGRVVWDSDGNVIFEAGEHQYFNDDFAAVCAYMSGN